MCFGRARQGFINSMYVRWAKDPERMNNTPVFDYFGKQFSTDPLKAGVSADVIAKYGPKTDASQPAPNDTTSPPPPPPPASNANTAIRQGDFAAYLANLRGQGGRG